MGVFGAIPLPNPNSNEVFKDVMDYLEQIRERKAKQPLRDAQAKREAALAELPFAGHQIPGAAGEALGLEMVRSQYGEDSPQYKMAKQHFDLKEARDRQTMAYQESLINSQPKRYATNEAKTEQELREVRQGKVPGSTLGGREGEDLSPQDQKRLVNQYGLSVLKKLSDPKTRQQALFAVNMEKTLDKLDVDALTSYSGAEGFTQLISENAKSIKGNPSEKFLKYQKAMTAAEILAKQVRQFYGASITPQVDKDLRKLTNPTNWLVSPKVAKEKFNQFKEILETEKHTIFQALKTPEAYEEGSEETGTEESTSTTPPVSNIEAGKMTIIDSTGKEHVIWRDKLDEARKRDPGLKVKKESFNAAKI